MNCPECNTKLDITINNDKEIRLCKNCSFCEVIKLNVEDKQDNNIGKQYDLFGKITKQTVKIGKLEDKYIVPNFSFFDTKMNYWTKRKKDWYKLIGFSGQGLDKSLLGGGSDNILTSINKGRSLFDPVLAEIILKWFCPKYGKILDPFGGEVVKGIVSEKLGYKYHAVEIRKKQVDENIKLAKNLGLNPIYINGDSKDINKLLGKYGKFDLCFTSPPYYNLEMYSTSDMSGSLSYHGFMKMYEAIFKECYAMLNDDRFLVVKISEIRNSDGAYYGFVPDNIKIFERIGFKYYNEIILLNAIGTGAFRANNMFKSRKVVRLHQNILVFYKGKIDNIKTIFGKEM